MCYFIVITVGFTQSSFSGSEAMGFVPVNLELIGGTYAYEFEITLISINISGNIVLHIAMYSTALR